MTIYTTTKSAGQSIGPLTPAMLIQYLSAQMSSDTGDYGTILGSANSPIDGTAPSAANFTGVVFQDEPTRAVQGMTLTCVQGTMNIIIGF